MALVAEDGDTVWATDVAVGTLWVLIAGILVFSMNAGFGCVEVFAVPRMLSTFWAKILSFLAFYP